MSDEDLIEEFRGGRTEAFEELVRRHQRPLLNFFYRLSWDRYVAEDCAQEVFLRLYRHLPGWDPRSKFTTFLYRVARNLWIDRVRSRQARGREMSLDAGAAAGGESAGPEWVAAGVADPGDEVGRGEEAQRLRQAIAGLPDDLRMVVVLAEFQHMRYDEISQILEIPVGTVKSRMHAAIDRLRGRLAPKATP